MQSSLAGIRSSTAVQLYIGSLIQVHKAICVYRRMSMSAPPRPGCYDRLCVCVCVELAFQMYIQQAIRRSGTLLIGMLT